MIQNPSPLKDSNTHLNDAEFAANGDLKVLRKHLRRARRELNHFQQIQSEKKVLQQLRYLPAFHTAEKIGLYLHSFGEIRTHLIIQLCFKLSKKVYLPMICNMDQRLVWVKVSQHQYVNRKFSHHPLGMKEPMQSRGVHVSHLDLLIMPLLACDVFGTRIGMGGGYYDRTLASAPHGPLRIGLAHDFQFVPMTLYKQKWDQALDYLLTPKHLIQFKRH
ncbi:5-formyltetrahydrofolate cyclo-ligase [Acinetobacter shaoyimingii]|uniref:5-formyltetrahydrofolate cyclo-ligase n=1 Tax=Acinetobacter shaoyimingii TaxID=2715164 RepID=A0A6G8RTZ2_9GAMM|nr:5-formyltetrahydrofolate cyclo-ligase [Acinetobacter shaoyimingii]QIO05384.1 5-formyltetrahydrofolate cyclo-ligase [Acinetobacter shaoyimingii]